MVDLLQAIMLGIVQGLTEWLPISSSGHLALFQLAMGLNVPVFFDLMLHIGTLTGVFAIYRKDIISILSSIFSYINLYIIHTNKTEGYDHEITDLKFVRLIIVGMIPTALIGIIFRSFFEFSFYNTTSIAIGFVATGFLVYVTKLLKNGHKQIANLDAFLIGIGQGLSIFSSISRSGATISVGMYRGLDKASLIKYSFLLSIPAIIGASVFDIATADKTTVSEMYDIPLTSYMAGILTSAVVGYASIKFLINVINKGAFYLFSFYCFAIGFITFLIL